MAVSLSGHAGEVRHGYFVAASITAWSLKDGHFSARITEKNTFRLSQAPLRVVVPFGAGSLTWPVLSLQIEGDALTAALGEKA